MSTNTPDEQPPGEQPPGQQSNYEQRPPAPPPKQRFFSARFALVGSTALSQFARIGTNLVLARVVSKGDYGVFYLVMMAPAFITCFGDLNVPYSIIAMRDRDDDEIFDTGTVLVLTLGLIYLTAFMVGATVLYYNVPEVQGDWRVFVVAAMLGVTTLLAMLYATQLSKLNREKRYGAEARQNLVFTSSQAITGIGFGLLGLGVFALALQGLISQVIANLMIQKHATLRFPRRATRASSWSFIKRGGHVAASNLAGSLESQAFTFSILRGPVPSLNLPLSSPTPVSSLTPDSGTERLGVWSRTLNVQALLSQNINVAAERLIYTNLCSAADDKPRFVELSRRALETLLLVNCITATIVYFNATDLTRVVLGPNWAEIPPLLKIMAFSIPSAALGCVGYMGCFAKNDTSPMMFWTIVRVILFTPLILIFGHWGIGFVAWVWVAGRTFNSGMLLIKSWKLGGMPPAQTLTHVGTIVAGCLFAAAAMITARHFLEVPFPGSGLLQSLARLVIISTVGLLLYFATIRVVAPDITAFVLRMVSNRKRPATP